jgi:hypothetical protein
MSAADYSFRFSDGIELRFRGLCVATSESDPYEAAKRRLDDGEDSSGEPLVEYGESFYLYCTESASLLLIRTFEVATGHDGKITLADRGAAYERFDTDEELTEFLKSHVDIHNPNCPYAHLLDQWGKHSVIDELNANRGRPRKA